MSQALREIRRPVETGPGRLLKEKLKADYRRFPDLPGIVRGHDDDIVQKARRFQIDPATIPKIRRGYDREFIWHATRLRNEVADNYRGFLVGVVGVGLADGLPFVIEGANDSPQRGIRRNCGEMGVIAKVYDMAQFFGEVALKYIYIAGPSDPLTLEETVGFPFPVLPPCDECRDMFGAVLEEIPDIVGPDVEVTMVAPETNMVLRDKLGNILRVYDGFIPPPSSEQLTMSELVESPARIDSRMDGSGSLSVSSIATVNVQQGFSPGGLMIASLSPDLARYN